MAQRKLLIELVRNDSLMSMKITLPKELEDFFKKLSQNETQVSEKWFNSPDKGEGIKFYKLVDSYNEIERKLSDRGLRTYNDFGDGLVKGNIINLAPLRCVRAGTDEQGVTLFSKSFASGGVDFEWYVRELSLAVKYLWQDFIGKQELKAVITYEI